MFDAKNVRMMNMKGKNIIRSLAAAALGLLGFSSCEKALDAYGNGEILCMYGQPYAEFKALGTVKNEAGKPVEGIRVAVRQTLRGHSEYVDDTVYTDSKGAYLLSNKPFNGPDYVRIVFEDVDGDANGGEFEKAEAKPAIKKTKEGTGWFTGAYEVKADVVMKKK